ncbi:hypothetical protein [Streptomyces sp. NPDC001594]|uniref:hypothetical protein n=1 Tax=Streptomyces sp. NPDC001594 TaxID=3364590 RepID=UPI003683D5BB
MSHSHSSPVSQVVRAALAPPRGGAAPVAGAALRAVEEARPARTLGAAVAAAGGVDGAAAERLRAWVAGLPGDRWPGLHDALVRHRGTLSGLLADVPPPAPPAAPGEVRPPVPRSVHATLALLLEHARPEQAAAALAVFPDRTRDALLAGGALPGPQLVTAVTEHGDTAARAALARHPRLDSRVLARLLAVGDAGVAAAVYRNPRCTTSLRRTLVRNLHRVPMDGDLRAELTDGTRLLPATWLTPLLTSGDPELTVRALRSLETRGVVQRHALVRIWETAGQRALEALLDGSDVLRHLSLPVCSAVRKALAEEDGSGNGLRRLREGGEPYEDPARLPALLATTRGTSSLAALLAEPYAHDMAALAEAHAKTPFMPKACEELARHEAADDAQRLAFRLSVLNEPWRVGGRRVGNAEPPGRRLAREPLDDSAAKWAEGMAAAGLLDPAGLIRTARPAVHAVAALARLTERGLLTDTARDELAALAATHLGERPEAWAALDAALPAHQGTLAELIAEAGRTPEPRPTRPTAPAPDEAPAHPVLPAQSGAPIPPAPAAQADGPAQPEASAQSAPPARAGESAHPGAPAQPDASAQLTTPAQGEGAEPSEAPGRPDAPSEDGAAGTVGRAAAVASAGQAAPPEAPRTPDERAALAALDLLYSLAPADAPLPEDPAVLRFLAHHRQEDAPGLATPRWLARACAAAGVEPSDGAWHTAPTAEEVRAERPRSWGAGTRLTEQAYTQGLLPADELVRLLPARDLVLLPHDWRRMAFASAWRGALARLLRTELGTDPDGWLRLARTAALHGGLDRRVDEGGPGWAELLRLSRTEDPGSGPHLPSGPPARGAASSPPATPDEALRLLEGGNRRWAWPLGTLLSLADAGVVDAVLPRLGPDGPWLLAAYLLRHDRTPRVLLDRLLAGRDPEALRVLASQSRRLAEDARDLLVDLDDPEVDLTLLRRGFTSHLGARIVTRPHGRTSARLLAELRADPSGPLPGGALWLRSREPALIEEVFARQGGELGFAQQAVGCLGLLEHGGAARLAALAGRDLLGPAAARLCAKALASKDPAAVLRARVERELDPVKLLTRLRRGPTHWQTTSAVLATPGAVDWEALAAAHEQEPLPNWEYLVNLRSAPAAVRLRYAGLLHEPGPDGLPDGPEATRARARRGLAGLHHCPPVTQLDGLLASGALAPDDLLRTAAPAARMLAYLNTAARRPDAPPAARTALAALAALVGGRLAADPAAWAAVVSRLTGRDPGWDPVSPVSVLLG